MLSTLITGLRRTFEFRTKRRSIRSLQHSDPAAAWPADQHFWVLSL